MGFHLAQGGVITVGVDYRNYPFATFNEMVEDVTNSFKWVKENIRI